MKVLLFGATGMVGQGVLRECLLDPRVTQVVSVGRSPLKQHAPGLSEILMPDLNAIAQFEEQLSGLDGCFFCLGVSVLGLSEADYTRLTHDLTLQIATVLAPRNPAMTFIYVSGAGTSRDSRQMWARVKARTEDDLAALPFKASYAFRPGLIQPLHGVVSKTFWYAMAYAALRPLAALLTRWMPSVATTSERLGQAMIAVMVDGYVSSVLESRDINQVCHR